MPHSSPLDRAELTRRDFLRATAGGAVAVAGWAVLGSAGRADAATAGRAATPAGPATAASGPAAVVLGLDTGWRFGGLYQAGSEAPGFDDAAFAPVTLPHSSTWLSWRNWEPTTWENLWIYRRHFDRPAGTGALRLFADFDGVLTSATTTLNGTTLGTHQGGYLPFSYELTDQVTATDNVLAVEVNATWQSVPPEGSPTGPSAVDYLEPGGINRNVRLRAVPQVFVADVFAKPVDVLTDAPQVEVSATIDAAVVPSSAVTIEAALVDGTKTIARASGPVTISAAGPTTATVTIEDFGRAHLWDVEDPHLYQVVTTLVIGGHTVHDFTRRIGFRQAVFEVDGFYLNGSVLKLFGLDRHQIFPYTGMAASDRVQRRDTTILRQELNCNMVRCSHYPQSPAFLDACDELGLMVWQETPGWQYIGDAAWQDLVVQNVHDMVVRDRNRPAVIIWGVQVNESPHEPTLYTETKDLANSLDGTRQTSGTNTSQSLTDWVQEVFAYDDYTSTTTDGVTIAELEPPVAGVPYLVTEAVGALDGAPYYRRIDTQSIQQEQARMHAEVHNEAGREAAYSGLLAWCAVDYDSLNGNIFDSVKWPGVIDTFRVLKPGAAFYQAQVSPDVQAVVAPSFYWDFGSVSPVTSLGTTATIWSNCDRIEAYVGGAHYATLEPDTTTYPNLVGPAFYLDASSIDGTALPDLRLDAYIGNRRAASQSYSSNPSYDHLEVTVDDTSLIADGTDSTRVVFKAVDRYGQPRPYVQGTVQVQAEGPAIVVGDVTVEVTADPALLAAGGQSTVTASVANGGFAFADNGGVGAVWVRTLAGDAGPISVTVEHATLGSGRVELRSTPTSLASVPGAGIHSAPNGTLDDLTVTVAIPAGWTATPVTSASSALDQGKTTTASWTVAAPSDLSGGTAGTVTVTAAFTADGRTGSATGSAPLGVPATLAATFNNVGISDDGDTASIAAADFDGVGNSYSEQALTAAGLAPGATLTVDGVSFTWPNVAATEADNTVALGQMISVSGSGTTLGFLGAGSPSQSGSGTVIYTDGSTSSYSVTLDNYFDAPESGNVAAATLPYINDSSSTYTSTDGKRDQTVYIFYTGVPLTAGKTVQAVVLPIGPALPASGRITGMHIFALGIG